MTKKIDAKTASFFPQLSKNATWGDAWDICLSQGYCIDVYDKHVGNDRPRKQQLDISLCKGNDEDSSVLVKKWELGEVDRFDYIINDIDIDFERIYRLVVEWLISNKYIKKPRNGKQIAQAREDEIKELKRLRDNITMRICAWKKVGKDVTELLEQKESLNRQIKAMR